MNHIRTYYIQNDDTGALLIPIGPKHEAKKEHTGQKMRERFYRRH